MALSILTENEAAGKEASRFRKWQNKMSKFIESSPIYLIAVHGGYNYEDMIFTVPVPENTIIIEMAFITEYASCLLGSDTESLAKLLQKPKAVSKVLTAPGGVSFAKRDIDLLARASKYVEGDRYYPRHVQLNKENSERPDLYYIVKYMNNTVTYMTDAINWLVDRTDKDVYTTLDQLIHYIQLHDPDASDGSIFLGATCASVNQHDSRITKELLWALIEHQEAHRQLYRKDPVRSFVYKPLSTRRNHVKPLRLENRTHHRRSIIQPTVSFIPQTVYKKKYTGLIPAPSTFTGTHKKKTYMTHMLETVNELPLANSQKKNTKKKNEQFMIKVNNMIFNKRGKTVFTYKETLRILRELQRVLPPTAQIEIYSSLEKRWSVFKA